jgi:hypothetical protein
LLERFLEARLVADPLRIERQYGKARRVWLMDRGVPTEEVLAEMRAADAPVFYLVGTPKGRLTRLQNIWLTSRGRRRGRASKSSCCRKTASSMSLPRARTESPRSGRCGGGS